MQEREKKKTYDILISLIVLFLFLGFLFLRMAWKLNYRFNNELVDICDNVVSDYESLPFKVVERQRYRQYDEAYFEKMDYYFAYVTDIKTAIDEGKISVRADYVYTIERILDDLTVLKDKSYYETYGDVLEKDVFMEMQAEKDKAYQDFNLLAGWHHTSLFFGITFCIASFVCLLLKIIMVKNKKEEKKEVIQ